MEKTMCHYIQKNPKLKRSNISQGMGTEIQTFSFTYYRHEPDFLSNQKRLWTKLLKLHKVRLASNMSCSVAW